MKKSFGTSRPASAGNPDIQRASFTQRSEALTLNVIAFSHLFGFYSELAVDLGPARRQRTFRRVKFVGEAVERERLVFHELGNLNRDQLKALNALYFQGSSDLPGSSSSEV